jgi:hypothetical protein
MRKTLVVLACFIPFFACGCPPQTCPTQFRTQEQLVAHYNANAAKAPRLWARATVGAHLVDDKGRSVDWGSTLLAPNAILALAKNELGALLPPDFVLIGSETGQEIFRLGVSTADATYYLWTNLGENSGGMYGRIKFAGAPGAAAIPINPLDLSSVLAITELPENSSQPPAVLMRLSDKPGQCAYVLTYIDRQSVTGKIVARRDIYMNWDADANRPVRPFRVDLLDEVGRVAMTASLKSYKPVHLAGEEVGEADLPVMPTDIEIAWPKTGSRIHIVLSEMKTKRIDPDAFLFWDRLPSPGVRKNLTCVDPQAAATQEAR